MAARQRSQEPNQSPRWSSPSVMQRELPTQQRPATTRPCPNPIHDAALTPTIGSLIEHEAPVIQPRQPHDAAFASAGRVAENRVLHSASCGGERDRSLISAQSFPRTHDLCQSARKARDGLLHRLPWFYCPIGIQMVCAFSECNDYSQQFAKTRVRSRNMSNKTMQVSSVT